MRMSKRIIKKLLPMLLSFILVVAMCSTYVVAEEYEGDDYEMEEVENDGEPEEKEEKAEPEEPKTYTLTVKLEAADDEHGLSGHVEIIKSGDVVADKDIHDGEAEFKDMESGSYKAKVTSVDSEGYECPDTKEFSIEDKDTKVTLKAPKAEVEEKEEEVQEEPEAQPQEEVQEEPEAQPQEEVQEEPEAQPQEEVQEEPEAQPQEEVQEEPEESIPEEIVEDEEINQDEGDDIINQIKEDENNEDPAVEDSGDEEAELQEDDKTTIAIQATGLTGADVSVSVNLLDADNEVVLPVTLDNSNNFEMQVEVASADVDALHLDTPALSGADADKYYLDDAASTGFVLAYAPNEPDPDPETRTITVIADIDPTASITATKVTGECSFSGEIFNFTLDSGKSWTDTFEVPKDAVYDDGSLDVEDIPGTDRGDIRVDADTITIPYTATEPEPEPEYRDVTVKASFDIEPDLKQIEVECKYDTNTYSVTLKKSEGWKTKLSVEEQETFLKGDPDVLGLLDTYSCKAPEAEKDNSLTFKYTKKTKEVTVVASFDSAPSVSSVYTECKFSTGTYEATLKKKNNWKATIQVPVDAAYKSASADKVSGYEKPYAFSNASETKVTFVYNAKTDKYRIKAVFYGGKSPSKVYVDWKVPGTSLSGTVKLTAANGYVGYTSDVIPENQIEDVVLTPESVAGYRIISSDNPVKYVSTDKVNRVPVQKKWIGPALSSVDVSLVCDGSTVSETTLNSAGKWKDSFVGDFYYYDQSTGEKLSYKVKESYKGNSVDTYYYDSHVSGNIDQGYVVTNTCTATVDFPVYKIWISEKTLDHIYVTLYADGKKYSSAKITSDYDTGHNYWKYSGFSDLPKYNSNGKEIKYEVRESVPDGFTATYVGYNGGTIIKNTQNGVTTETTTRSAKTGDDNPLLLYILALACALGVIGFVVVRKKK